MALGGHFDKPSIIDKVYVFWVILRLPLALLWHALLIASPFSTRQRFKSWKRTLADRGWRFMLSQVSAAQLRFVMGMQYSLQLYESWSRKRGLTVLVEEIEGEDAKLMWLNGKKAEKVVYYLHGGGYALPLQDYALAFWIHVQRELKKKHGIDVGIAILAYTLTPDSPFPTILRQAVGGFNLLLGQDIRPENIQFAGDSAGGNLILQFLSHALHPLPTVPTISTGTISGAYLMSPWVSLSGEEGNQVEHDESDVISAIVTQHLGDTVLCDVPNFQRHYVEVLKAPDMWFDGVEKVVKRILISTGDDECFRDDNIMLNERLQKKHPDVQFILQKFGVHIDPMIDAFAGERMDGVITPKMVDWLAEGFRS